MSEIKTNKLSPRKGTTQTIGDSGDTVSIASGATLSNAGTISTAGITGGTIDNQGTITGLAGVINWDTTAKTTGFTAVSNTGYFCNTTSAAFTVTFPASPTAGDVIAIKDYANTFNTNNLTIDPNGNKIQGLTINFKCTDEGAALQFIYVDATRGWVLVDASKASDIAQAATFITATGGTITTCGDYKIHTFNSPGTFCVSSIGNPIGGPNNVDYLVVAGGGGGGGAYGGGGGAGGLRESHLTATSGCYTASPLASSTSLPVSATGYPVTIGGGGAASPGGPGAAGSGSNSVFSTITSAGGGGGGSNPSPTTVGTGGSGGGGGSYSPIPYSPSSFNPGGAGNTPPVSPPQGNTGGSGLKAPNGTSGGGGGGAGVTGSNAIPNFYPYEGSGGGDGGAGVTTSISSSPTAYAGGGGGATEGEVSAEGAGGVGGGGAGWYNGCGGSPSGAATAGTANTGGGGGGGASSPTPGAKLPAAGGSGIVIIRYKYQ